MLVLKGNAGKRTILKRKTFKCNNFYQNALEKIGLFIYSFIYLTATNIFFILNNLFD